MARDARLDDLLRRISTVAPVAGFRPIRRSRCCTTSLAMPGSMNSPHRSSSCSDTCCSSSKNSRASVRLMRPVSAPPTPTPQPALSVRQPWTWALLYGGKTIENRKRRTHYRGRIWIHASERENRDDIEEAVRLVAQSWKCNPRQAIEHYREHAHHGAILGSMALTDCRRLDELDRSDPLRSSPWAGGPWLWLASTILGPHRADSASGSHRAEVLVSDKRRIR